MGISFLKKKRFSPFERRFPYLLLWNFSDGTGWKILRGAWNLRGTCDTKIQVIEVSVSSLYYLFSVILLALMKIRASLRIESFAVINLRGVSTNKTIIYFIAMQTYKKLIIHSISLTPPHENTISAIFCRLVCFLSPSLANIIQLLYFYIMINC
jgi:hypothetical protein